MSAPTNSQVAMLAAIIHGQQYPASIDRLLRDADRMLAWLDEKDFKDE